MEENNTTSWVGMGHGGKLPAPGFDPDCINKSDVDEVACMVEFDRGFSSGNIRRKWSWSKIPRDPRDSFCTHSGRGCMGVLHPCETVACETVATDMRQKLVSTLQCSVYIVSHTPVTLIPSCVNAEEV